MKRIFPLFAAAVLLAGCSSKQAAPEAKSQQTEAAQTETAETQDAGTASGTSVFSDVPEDYWAKDAIDGLYAKGWLSQTGEFRPDDQITRGEYIQMLAAAFPAKYTPYGDAYADVKEGDAVYDAVSMVGGDLTSDANFEAERTVTREEAVTAIAKAIGFVAREMEISFSDADQIAAEDVPYIGFAAETGLVEDGEDVAFDAKKEITRAEAADFLYRAATYKGDADRPSGNVEENGDTKDDASVVYMTTDLSPEGLMKIYKELNWQPVGNVGVKMSTGEAGGDYYLHPDFIKDLVHEVNGTIIECNTAYGGSRATTAIHRQTIADHGFNEIADVDIMDEEGSIDLPVREGSVHLEKDMVGSHLANYDSILVLSHFKGHAMGGFGGALKNISIGIASQKGKMYIHSGGRQDDHFEAGPQNDFLESMAEAAGAVMQNKEGHMVYISVMNNLSVDCDCDGNPEEPDMHDIGILASYDPVALDRACVDLVYAAPDSARLVQRIESRNGTRILDHAEELGMGSQNYKIVTID